MSSGTPRTGHKYGSISIEGENRVHLGNSYVTNNISQANETDIQFDQSAISLTNPRYDAAAIKREKPIVQGTCAWVLKDPAFCQWRDDQGTRILCITGNPGTGKTTISSFLLRELDTTETPKPICFFCDSRITNRRTDIAILRGLLMQINQMPGRLGYVERAFNRYHEVPKSKIYSNFDALWGLLWKILRAEEASSLVVIIDAIDECDYSSQKRLLDALDEELRYSPRSDPKFIITSRSEKQTNPRLQHTQHAILHINSQNIKGDLDLYIDDRINYLKEQKDYDEKLQAKVKNKLLETAGGTFLWVSLVIDQLDRLTSNQDVEITLRILPNTLFGLYDTMLERIPHDSRHFTQFVLRLAATSRRPLTTGEVLVAYDLRSSKFWHRGKLDLHKCLLRTEIINSRSELLYLKKENNGTETLHFIHESAREYLLERPKSRHQRLSLCSIYGLIIYKIVSCLFAGRALRMNAVVAIILTVLGAYISYLRPIRKLSRRFDVGVLTRLPGLKSTRIHYYVDERAANFLLFRICFKTLGFWDRYTTLDESGRNPLRDLFQYATQEMHSHATAASEDVVRKFPWKSELLNQVPNRRDIWLKLVFETMHHSTPRFQSLLRSKGANTQALGGCRDREFELIPTDLDLTLIRFAIGKSSRDIAKLLFMKLDTSEQNNDMKAIAVLEQESIKRPENER